MVIIRKGGLIYDKEMEQATKSRPQNNGSAVNRAARIRAACRMRYRNSQATGQQATDGSREHSDRFGKGTAQTEVAYPLTVKDELGHELTIPAKPGKVFAPVMEDSLLSLGIKPAMQWSNGVSPQEYLQDQLGSVPQISFAGGTPSFEVILESQPDLIILHNSYSAENGAYEKYAKIAPTYVFKSASTDLNSSVGTLGKLLGVEDKAEQALKNYADKAADAKAKLAAKAEGKKPRSSALTQKECFS